LIDTKVDLTNNDYKIVIYKLEAKEIDTKKEVKVDIEKEVKVDTKRKAEADTKEEVKIDTKGEVKDSKLDAKVEAKEVKVLTVRIFGFCIKIFYNFRDFGIIE